jgi:hypothetical protein
MIIPNESPSRVMLERIASEFRRQGYDVLVEPRGHELPDFLSDAAPDLIARRQHENIVIEAKRSPSKADREQISVIAARIAQQPGWQFVLMAPRAPDDTETTELTMADESAIRELLQEADAIARLNMPAAALMSAWAATEGAVRLLIIRSGIRVDRGDAATLVRALASEGLISDVDFHLLNDAHRFGGAIAHGRQAVRDEVASRAQRTTQDLVQFASRILTELRSAA